MLLHIFEFWSDAHLLVLQWCSFIFTVGPFTQCLISWLCTQTWIKLLVSFCELKEKSIKVNQWLLLNKPLYSMLKLNCRSAESMIDCGVQLLFRSLFQNNVSVAPSNLKGSVHVVQQKCCTLFSQAALQSWF